MAAFYRLFSRCKRPVHEEQAQEEPTPLPRVPEDDNSEEATSRAPAVESTVVEVKQIARLQPPDLVLPESAPACTSTVRSQTVDGHTTWIASVVTSRSTPSSTSTTSRLTGGTALSPVTAGSELASRPSSRGSRPRRKRDTPKRLVGRPKLVDSRPCSTRRSEETDSIPCSTRRSEGSEPEALPVAEEITEEITCSGLSKSLEAPPEVVFEEALESQHEMEALPEVASEEALESQHVMEVESVKEPLWVPHISAESEGMIFYHNVSTNEVTWDRPAPEDLQLTEWVLHTSAEGRQFYFNEKTKETSWELVPGGVVVPGRASLAVGGAGAAAEKSVKKTDLATAENSVKETEVVATTSTESRLFRPPLLDAPPDLPQRHQEPPPRIDQGSPVRTKRMDAGFEKWAMSLCMDIAPNRPEVGGPPPAKKGFAAPMLPPPG